MLSENRKIIVWFLVCLVLALYIKFGGLGSSSVLGKSTVSSPGFGPLLPH